MAGNVARQVALMMVASGCLVQAGMAWAWGPEGHALVADMAQAHLSPAAASEVRRLLSVEGYRRLDQVSSWPDAIRSAEPTTGPWHYVDIPLYAVAYSAQRDCHVDEHGQRVVEMTCVVAKLPEFVHMLADASQGDARRLVALKWVVHLVADIHQPLHAEDDHDRGGNDVRLPWYGQPSNLHAIWDLGIIEHRFGWQLGPRYSFDHEAVRAEAARLDAVITAQQREQWAPAGAVAQIDLRVQAWANGSHALACAVYRHLPPVAEPGWENGYQSWAWPVAQGQLERASVRLAGVLNEALK